MLRNPCLHGRSYAQGLMHTAEVIVHEVTSQSVGLVLNLLAEGIGQPRHVSQAHTHREVLALHEAG